MSDQYQVIGFLNRGIGFPTWLITVLEKDHKVYLVFPSGDYGQAVCKGLPATVEQVQERLNFVPYVQNKRSDDPGNLRSFGLSSDDIFMGSMADIEGSIRTAFNDGARVDEERQGLEAALAQLNSARAEDGNSLVYTM